VRWSKCLHFDGGVIDRIRQIDSHRENVLGPEAGLDSTHAQEALEHQARARKQHQGQRDFRDHQGTTQSFMAARHCSGALTQGLAQRTPGRLQCRYQAKRKARRDGDSQREGQHPSVDMNIIDTWDSASRRKGEQSGHAPYGQEHTGCTAGD
jgi:hypothetical protein